MVYHPRGYTEEALGTWLSVSTIGQPYTHHPRTHIGWRLDSIVSRFCTVFHSWRERTSAEMCHMLVSLLTWSSQPERAPRQRRARRRPTAQTTTRVEDSDEVPAVPEPTVLDLPPEQTPDTEPSPSLEQPLEQPQEPEPSRHPPIRRIYTRRQKNAIGAPEPSFALCLQVLKRGGILMPPRIKISRRLLNAASVGGILKPPLNSGGGPVERGVVLRPHRDCAICLSAIEAASKCPLEDFVSGGI
ncbi:hypothetical protein H6P81_002888 [Aristolochia fimbriata]|uniref:Uncharacterized protein n=1 Tax=Aristolochia fimbriata TaxID=158543 RepID=A0AAV7FDX5_ARIFI|nr:hypothetical protein H6P81_002888 [Aristolochia fimbriata]